jgi:glycosyltransferase involved in cell wall biosynthesis
MSMCVCVPVYNDWENARLLIENFISCDFKDVKLLIIDNGSNESQAAAVASTLNALQDISFHRIEANQGFGGAIKEASKLAKEEWLVWMPGNMKVLPSDLLDFFDLVRLSSNNVFVKSKRTGRPIADRIKTGVASIVQTLASGKRMSDTGGTPCALNRNGLLWGEIESAPDDYRFDSFMLYSALQARVVVERPKVRYHKRLIGESHWQSGFVAELTLLISLLVSIIRWRFPDVNKNKEGKSG